MLSATAFAAYKHRNQRRKGATGIPYINHPIGVVRLMSELGRVQDINGLMAGMLHDTVEDTDTTPDEIEEQFGATVRALVMEVTDDKSLEKSERKRLQIEHAPHLSPLAKMIKLADKIENVTDIGQSPPVHWDLDRALAYLDWGRQVVAGFRGISPPLEALFDKRVAEAEVSLLSR